MAAPICSGSDHSSIVCNLGPVVADSKVSAMAAAVSRVTSDFITAVRIFSGSLLKNACLMNMHSLCSDGPMDLILARSCDGFWSPSGGKFMMASAV